MSTTRFQQSFAMRSINDPMVARVPPTVQLLLICEGGHDVAFLKRISRILHAAIPALPDLTALENARRLVIIPIGGSNVVDWRDHLAAFHEAGIGCEI